MKGVIEVTLAAAALAISSAATASVFPTGTYIYTGSVRNYAGALLSEASRTTIQAVDTNGNVVAETQVVDPTESGHNYRLAVPLTSRSTSTSATKGDSLRCVAIQDGAVYATTFPLPDVGDANTSTNCDLALAVDSDGDGVPDEYVDGLAAWMESEGLDPSGYDASADYDGDGSSNYAEYAAGTDPFDENDLLRITAFSKTPENEGGLPVLSFEYSGGRIYCVASSTNLAPTAGWARVPHYYEASTNDPHSAFVSAQDDIGVKTLYLAPAAKSQFFVIRVNPEE